MILQDPLLATLVKLVDRLPKWLRCKQLEGNSYLLTTVFPHTVTNLQVATKSACCISTSAS